MFIGWYSKKTDYNKHKKVIFADFDPFLHPHTLKTGIFMPFYQLSGAFLARRNFENITFDFYGYSPYM